MKLTHDYANFYETFKEYDHYGSTIELTKDSIPDGARMTISPRDDDHISVHIGRVYPFNEAVKAARKDMQTYSQLRSDADPTVKFYIADWTPEKLAETQARLAERTAKHRELTREYHEATKVYNAALETQRLEITGEVG